ncbi:peptide deformylase [Blastopirellula sp. JC732]|uniref:Peptide deformylase n=1 Tax=Blastopirellula sediminis TaxID=2894196 RepID=A0A9X1SFQ4_9BACT|nr:peptide deformylase [Blastopirellula sediminis]MCC9607252.1 peptide deformylase [Blastopirellula sediminis]MCC9629455.1 peptide deformylase [Blastopirellula sediminis]
MPLQVVHYPHPTLRYKSKPVKRVDADLRKIVDEMFELMYENRGIGLAANQVDLPIRLFVVNLSGTKGEGEELVFINPVISRPKGNEEGEEGCLSLPQVYGPVKRPAEIQLDAYNLQGQLFSKRIDGMLARVVQHETDHLDGIMFFDRMQPAALQEIAYDIEEFVIDYKSRKDVGGLPTDEEIAERRQQYEETYC